MFGPAGLRQTTFPTRRISLPKPFIHGYVVEPGSPPEDVTTFLSPSGAWASGAIVSTPADLGAFIRADLGQRFFGAAEQAEQMRFVTGSSSPPGPGANAAGLALFRYTTRCGVVYGHTGNFPGYVAVGGGHRGRDPLGHDHAQHPGAHGRAAAASARGPDRRGVRPAVALSGRSAALAIALVPALGRREVDDDLVARVQRRPGLRPLGDDQPIARAAVARAVERHVLAAVAVQHLARVAHRVPDQGRHAAADQLPLRRARRGLGGRRWRRRR